MEYHIRPMEDRDISTVEQIEKSIFSLPWSAKSFADAANTPENVYLVCECTGEIAGYCVRRGQHNQYCGFSFI